MSVMMPAATTLVSPTQARPDTPIPEKMVELTNVQLKERSPPTPPRHKPDPLFPPPSPYTAMLPIQIQIVTDSDSDSDTESSMAQSEEEEDEYTISAYGEIPLSQVIIPPSHSSSSLSPNTSPLQPRFPQPNLCLRIRRPPMPKRRVSYVYIPDPLPFSGGLDPDDRWPGSPRPIAKNQRWHQHQPMLPPLSIAPPSSWTPKESVPAEKNCSGIKKSVNEPLLSSPTIRLPPPGSPATQPVGPLQESRQQKSGVPKLPLSSPTPAPPQNAPKPAPWRTRLPPRRPIPKWDI